MKLHGLTPAVSHISSRNPPKHPPSLFGLRRVRRALIPRLTPGVFSRRRIKNNENPKSEILNKSQITNPKYETQTGLEFVVWNLEIVSDLGFRAWDLAQSLKRKRTTLLFFAFSFSLCA
jgi:hypothetical protein